MADNSVEFELAEACLAPAVGNAAVQAYQRSSMLERRRPIMQRWADYVTRRVEGGLADRNADHGRFRHEPVDTTLASAWSPPRCRSVGYESEPDAKGERLIWHEVAMADRARRNASTPFVAQHCRGPGESYSDVILRLVASQNEERAKSP
jgi:hypothetical protein